MIVRVVSVMDTVSPDAVVEVMVSGDEPPVLVPPVLVDVPPVLVDVPPVLGLPVPGLPLSPPPASAAARQQRQDKQAGEGCGNLRPA